MRTETFEFINSIVTHFYKDINMTAHFVYVWFDRTRKMFYVGQHTGSYNDQYTSSSRWLAGEIRYRPNDFKRRIIRTFSTKHEAQLYEGKLLTLIRPDEFGTKYYNLKMGAPKGNLPWNTGKTNVYSKDTLDRMSAAKKGRPSHNKGKTNPLAAQNGKKGASKLAKTVTGRRMATRPDGTRYWVYPGADCLGDKEQSANPHSITA